MGEVIAIESRLPHAVYSNRCNACGHKAIGVVPVGCDLATLECGRCGACDSSAELITHVSERPPAAVVKLRPTPSALELSVSAKVVALSYFNERLVAVSTVDVDTETDARATPAEARQIAAQLLVWADWAEKE
jgi:hypothetical protein